MSRKRHYRNYVEAGRLAFVTTTILDFVPIFYRRDLAIVALTSLLDTLEKNNGVLHAFVLMPEHLHFVTRLPSSMNASRFMQVFKSLSGIELQHMLMETERAKFSQQVGLNKRTVWQRSFRSFQIDDNQVFNQKCDYIHLNPCRRELCEKPWEYRWSSFSLWEQRKWSPDRGLMDCMQEFLKIE
jgi:REP element-mobilizing transposase RayT